MIVFYPYKDFIESNKIVTNQIVRTQTALKQCNLFYELVYFFYIYINRYMKMNMQIIKVYTNTGQLMYILSEITKIF